MTKQITRSYEKARKLSNDIKVFTKRACLFAIFLEQENHKYCNIIFWEHDLDLTELTACSGQQLLYILQCKFSSNAIS